LREGQKVTFEAQTDPRSGKIAADKLEAMWSIFRPGEPMWALPFDFLDLVRERVESSRDLAVSSGRAVGVCRCGVESWKQAGSGSPSILSCRPWGDRGTAMKWLILALFLGGMFASLNWYEAANRERRMAFGAMTLAAFALVLVLGITIMWGGGGATAARGRTGKVGRWSIFRKARPRAWCGMESRLSLPSRDNAEVERESL
jgi:hypothetical protein